MAPLWGIVAGLLVSAAGVGVVFGDGFPWASRWQSTLIAGVHCLVLGVVAQTMIGALYQVLPVLGGRLIGGGLTGGRTVMWLLNLGLLCLVGGLTTSIGLFWVACLTFLPVSLLIFSISALRAAKPESQWSGSLLAVRCSLLSLVFVLLLGALQVSGYSAMLWPAYALDRHLTDIHLLWGVGGWIGLLVMGVSYQVVPMFHVTPALAAQRQKIYPLLIMASLLLTSVVWWLFPDSMLATWARWLNVFAFLGYVGELARALKQRKRKLEDASVKAWWTGIGSYLGFIVVLAARDAGLMWLWPLEWVTHLELAAGGMLIFGTILAVVLGMQLKILPFLSYLHMQRACGSDFSKIKSLPSTRDILPEIFSLGLVKLHWLNLSLIILMIFYFELAILAGLGMLAEFGLLAFSTHRVLRLLKRHI
ncbi:MAG: hypothetical protein H6999_03365 [Hahellaceae bacterium]|nr:hypothetical protein [Hahellaceae bacterium]MCP5168777.1 hypothetical protein [Hahellaceae bacterium]